MERFNWGRIWFQRMRIVPLVSYRLVRTATTATLCGPGYTYNVFQYPVVHSLVDRHLYIRMFKHLWLSEYVFIIFKCFFFLFFFLFWMPHRYKNNAYTSIICSLDYPWIKLHFFISFNVNSIYSPPSTNLHYDFYTGQFSMYGKHSQQSA